jgi:hypothetical protein
MAAVVSLPSSSRMTEAEYRRARDELRATYGETRAQASAQADQAWAALFVRSGWTQDQLAAAEGKSQAYVSLRVLFGKFLVFITTVINPEFAPIRANLTEWRFRAYWKRTKDLGSNERQRFLAVQKALLADVRIGRSTRPKKAIGLAVKETCADGKWHAFSVIHERVRTVEAEAAAADVATVLEWIVQRSTYGLTGEKQKGAQGWRYKLHVSGAYIPLRALMQEIGPLLAGLEAEGKKNSATASPPTVAHLTFQLRQVLERLTTERTKDNG